MKKLITFALSILTFTVSVAAKSNSPDVPIEGFDEYYIRKDYNYNDLVSGYYIIDKEGNKVSDSYRWIADKITSDGTIAVSSVYGRSDSRMGVINKNFETVVPCEYYNVVQVYDRGFSYIIGCFGNPDKYYMLDGTEEKNLYKKSSDYFKEHPNESSDVIIASNHTDGTGYRFFDKNIDCDLWAKKDIMLAIDFNIVPEKLQCNYRDKITREEFCELAITTYLAKKEWINNVSEENLKTPFSDVDNPYVSKAYELGIVNGTGNGKFSPNDYITRQEAAVMLCNMAKILDVDYHIEKVDTFTVDEKYFAQWAKDSIYKICGIISNTGAPIMIGTDVGKFSPWFSYQRQQAIVTMERLLETKSNTSDDYRESFSSDINKICDSYTFGNRKNSLFSKESYNSYSEIWKNTIAQTSEQWAYADNLCDAYNNTMFLIAIAEGAYNISNDEKYKDMTNDLVEKFRDSINMDSNELMDATHGSKEFEIIDKYFLSIDDYSSMVDNINLDEFYE